MIRLQARIFSVCCMNFHILIVLMLRLLRVSAFLATLSLPLVASTCGGSDTPTPAPTPAMTVPRVYSVHSRFVQAAGSRAYPNIEFEVAPYVGNRTNPYFVKAGDPNLSGQVRPNVDTTVVLPMLPSKATAHLYLNFYEPVVNAANNNAYRILQGDRISIELLGDGKVMQSLSLDYAEAMAGKSPVLYYYVTYNGQQYLDTISKTLEFTLP